MNTNLNNESTSLDRDTICDCGTRNPAIAFRCQGCGKIFDGRAGNTIPAGRMVTRTGAPGSADSSLLPSRPTARTVDMFTTARYREITAAPKVAIITFNSKAKVWAEPAAPNQIPRFTMNPSGSTNEAAGLQMAGELAKRHGAGPRLSIILFGDGEPTDGGGLFGSDTKAAVDAADELKGVGARIATIGFDGPTVDFAHLREVASSPALALRARAGTITSAFVSASRSLTQNRLRQTGEELIVFLIDESGSMDEGTKKREVEDAVRASLEYLSTL